MPRNIKFGAIKDRRDERAFLHQTVPFEKLPPKIDLSKYLVPVNNQGNLGACTGFGIGGNIASTFNQLGEKLGWFSPMWIYNGERLLEGTLDEDSGAQPVDGFRWLVNNGGLLEKYHPYKDILDKTDPTTWEADGKKCSDLAKDYPVLSYVRCVDGETGLCSALAQCHFVSLGSPWYESWMEYGENSGSLSQDHSQVAGGHETLLYGYDLKKRVFYGQNSWGEGWGHGGRYVMPFAAIKAFKRDGGYDGMYLSLGTSPWPPEGTCR